MVSVDRLLVFCLALGVPFSSLVSMKEVSSKDVTTICVASIAKYDLNLRTGDLVFRNGKGLVSSFFRNTSQTERKYSHVGVLVKSNGKSWVYHMIEDPNGKNDFKRETLESFCSNQYNHGFAAYRYPLSAQQLKRFHSKLNFWRNINPEFDSDFDLNSDNALYCTEFIQKTLLEPNGISSLKSSHQNQDYIGLDDLYINNQATLICQIDFP